MFSKLKRDFYPGSNLYFANNQVYTQGLRIYKNAIIFRRKWSLDTTYTVNMQIFAIMDSMVQINFVTKLAENIMGILLQQAFFQIII